MNITGCLYALQVCKNDFPLFVWFRGRGKRERKREQELRAVNLSHVFDKVHHAVAVAPLVVVPRHKLHKVIREGDTRLGIEDRRARVADKVGRYDVFVGVAEDALQRA